MTSIPVPSDPNFTAAALLSDMALVHPSPHGGKAYRRASRAVLGLERPIAELAAAGELRSVSGIGPSTARVVLETLAHGGSPTVERAIAASSKREAVTLARSQRRGFLSRAAVLEVLAAPARGVIALGDARGDLQMHTPYSDGTDPIISLADGARARGYGFIAITDHSRGLPIAGGMSMEKVAVQHREIESVNRDAADGFRVLRGIETNIDGGGALDLDAAELMAFEIVLAAPHSQLRKDEDQTARMLAAVRTPGVCVLAHPRGRMLSRPGVSADWPRVFAEAARLGVAVELDGDPYRQDLDWELAREALDAKCLFALDSDAHSVSELAYTDWSLAHARLAGIPAERVINTWTVDRLLAWGEERRTSGPPKKGKPGASDADRPDQARAGSGGRGRRRGA